MPTYRVYFRWDANPEGDIAGYRLYIGRATGVYDHADSPQEMGNVTSGSYLVQDTTDRLPWYFALTALNANAPPNDESGFSAEVQQDFLTHEAVEGF